MSDPIPDVAAPDGGGTQAAERGGALPARAPSPGPGDERPRRLARPPGERYQRVSRVVAPMEHPRLGRALLLGLATVSAIVVVSALLRDILDLSSGLLVVAGAGGWLIGAGVRQGAWAGRPHLSSRILGLVGLGLGALCWLLGLLAAWLLSMAILPGSSRSLPDRLAATPFMDWLSPQLDPLDFVQLLLLVGVAWYVARSGAVPMPR